ncbi:hypothetical protein HGRIS_007934 [Hohenbuehelia grisea]|uniref:Peroxin domain-containing protein n=1 Tax=Hohenbuehelia grisea TaxID=104357 RepID=A0ABR3J6E0_9AGAR
MALNARLSVPPPLPQRRSSGVSTDTPSLSLPSDPQMDECESVTSSCDELSEDQLRALYEDEEIERFLHIFSTAVTEVRVPGTSPDPATGNNREQSFQPKQDFSETSSINSHAGDNLQNHPPNSSEIPISAIIANWLLLPILPPPRMTPPAFTLGRLRLNIQRLYLAAVPGYASAFHQMFLLASWENKRQSLFFCSIYWILWYHNLLLPALFLRLFYSLTRRGLATYPTLDELRERRREADKAASVGDEFSSRLSASPTFGLKEMWRLFKAVNKPKKAKAKQIVKEETGGNPPPSPSQNSELSQAEPIPLGDDDTATVFDDPDETPEEKDTKRQILHVLSEIADFHERLKNVCIWRRPASSRRYCIAIFVLFIVTLCFPAKYLAKSFYLIIGVAFWHVTPIILALPPPERARLPPPLVDVPTDADYAMELISQRVASGLDVTPKKRRGLKTKKPAPPSQNTSATDLSQDVSTDATPDDRSVNWKKWGDKLATGKALIDDGRRLVMGGNVSISLPIFLNRLNDVSCRLPVINLLFALASHPRFCCLLLLLWRHIVCHFT